MVGFHRRVTRQVLLVQWRNPLFSWVRFTDVRWHNRTVYTLTWFRTLLSRHFTDWAELGVLHIRFSPHTRLRLLRCLHSWIRVPSI